MSDHEAICRLTEMVQQGQEVARLQSGVIDSLLTLLAQHVSADEMEQIKGGIGGVAEAYKEMEGL